MIHRELRSNGSRELERSGETHIDANATGPDDVVHRHVPKLTVLGLREGRAVDPLIDGPLLRIWIR
jgi:hypothetical protein